MINVAMLTVEGEGVFRAFSSAAWAYAGKMTLLGMMMIFAVLGALWGVLAIFKLVFAQKTPKAKTSVPTSAPIKAEEPAEIVTPDKSNDELIAVITAAVAAYMAEENGGETSTSGFRVVSFRRVGGGGAWNSK